jgi:hypothetical protein
MAAISSIIAAVGALGSLAAGVSQFAGKKSSTPSFTPASAPVPAGPPPDLTADELKSKAPGALPSAPNFLQFGSGMTNQQKRAQIATFGTQGSDSRYSDPATADYYKNLVSYDYAQPNFNILPAERSYAENVLGAKPRADTSESFLSAILRG